MGAIISEVIIFLGAETAPPELDPFKGLFAGDDTSVGPAPPLNCIGFPILAPTSAPGFRVTASLTTKIAVVVSFA